MSLNIEDYARKHAQERVDEIGPGMESEEVQVQRIQSEIVEELQAKETLFKSGYAVLMEEVKEREANEELAVSSEGLEALEEARQALEEQAGAQPAAPQQPSAPPPPSSGQDHPEMGPGLDGFIEPGKIIFRP